MLTDNNIQCQFEGTLSETFVLVSNFICKVGKETLRFINIQNVSVNTDNHNPEGFISSISSCCRFKAENKQ